jgi:hypothetical protein
MLHQHTSTRRLGAAIAGLLAFAAPSAFAETGSATGADVSVHVNLLGIAQLDVDALAPTQIDNATTATHEENSAAGVDNGDTFVHLTTGALATQAEYAPGVAISAAGGSASVTDLHLTAVSLLGDGLLSITGNLIQSRSSVMGYCLPSRGQNRDMFDDIAFFNGFDEGNLNAGGPNGHPDPGDVVLDGVEITILGIPVPTLPLNPPPNTAVDLSALGIVGATLILNEQTLGGDGVTSATLTSNALHLTLNVASLITADVVIAHTDAKLDCTQ